MTEPTTAHEGRFGVPVGRIEAALQGLYERRRGRYPNMLTWLFYPTWIPAIILLLTGVGTVYVPLPADRLPLIWPIMAAVLYGTAEVGRRRYIVPLVTRLTCWLDAGRPAEETEGLWLAVAAVPPGAIRIIVTLGLGLSILGGVAVSAVLGLSVSDCLAIGAMSIVGVLWTATAEFFVIEVVLRPVQLDAAAHLPGSFVPPKPTVTLARRVLGWILVASILATSVGVLVGDRGASTPHALLGWASLAIVVALGLSLGLTASGAASLLRPVDDLIAATRRLAAGDLSARAPVGSGDELGMLAVSFNAMAGELQRSREQLVTAREEERRRLRRDLHDGLGPALTGVAMRLEAAQGLIDRDPAAARAMLGQLHAATVDAIGDIRRLVHGLRPPQLDELGLIGAISERAAMLAPEGAGQPLRVTLDVPSELPALPAALEVAAYRIADEALTNVVRHAGARACTVRLSVGDELAIEVRDDGRGIMNGHRAGVGMSSMRERAAELGGSCDVRGVPEGGTIVQATLPLPAGPA